ncbi:MAG: DUF1778 domain-containing protein [Streptococcaceae bacterium]|nr:DUF1778 domain-containing protein [Streptococcaceae bacterium]
MSTITFRVSEEEKQFIEQMANLHHVSLSELVKKIYSIHLKIR